MQIKLSKITPEELERKIQEQENVPYHPNFIKLSHGKFWDKIYREYLYFDCSDFFIDRILIQEKVNANFAKSHMYLPNSNIDLVLCRVRVSPKKAPIVEQIVFPKLHIALKALFGEEYLDRCLSLANKIMEFTSDKEMDIDEIFCRRITTDM